MNQCACDCHKKLTYNPVPSNGLIHEVGELKQKLESQQKQIDNISSYLTLLRTQIIDLEKQRDIGMERINKLESDFSELKNQTLWIDEINKRLDERVDRIDTRIYQLESKLEQQISDEEVENLLHDASKKLYPPEKKTKTLWIGVDKKPFNRYGHHHVSTAIPLSWLPDDPKTKKVLKIEIDVDE